MSALMAAGGWQSTVVSEICGSVSVTTLTGAEVDTIVDMDKIACICLRHIVLCVVDGASSSSSISKLQPEKIIV